MHHHLIGQVFSFLMVNEIMTTRTVSGVLELMKSCSPQYLSSYSPQNTLLYLVRSSTVPDMPCPSLPPSWTPALPLHWNALAAPSHTPIQPILQRPTKEITVRAKMNTPYLCFLRPVIHIGNELHILLFFFNSFRNLWIISMTVNSGREEIYHFTHFIPCKVEYSALQLIKLIWKRK